LARWPELKGYPKILWVLREDFQILGFQISKRFTMTRPHAIVGSALATAFINVLVALVLVAQTPASARIEPQKLNDSTPLYRLSPIPAGADWGRS
jgi:hypothetical protein